MLVGNKCYRVTEREVSTQEGSALAKELGCDFVEASAKNCVNVEKAFYEVVRQLRRQRNQGAGGRVDKVPKGLPGRNGTGRGRSYVNDVDGPRKHKDGRNGDRTRSRHGGDKSKKEKPSCTIL
jgi:GTPase KRas protein